MGFEDLSLPLTPLPVVSCRLSVVSGRRRRERMRGTATNWGEGDLISPVLDAVVCSRRICGAESQACQSSRRIAKRVQLDVHAIHDRQVHAAEFAVVVTALEEVQHAAGFQPAAQTAGEEHGQLA